nr:hypothetical protein [Thermus scotoductus]
MGTLTRYLEEAMARARYELIEDEEPYYGEVPDLPGVWATGKSLREKWGCGGAIIPRFPR